MKKTSKTIVFFGSGPVSAKSLKLLQQDFEIEAVITKPTTKHEMTAVAGDTPVHTVSTKSELNTLIDSHPFSSTVAVLIDFGIIVSQKVIDYFPLGIINSHFSLLPQLRGADPISFAILEGLKKTGVSLMLLVKGMDEGPLLATTAPISLSSTITTPALTDMLIESSHQMIVAILPLYIAGKAVAQEQNTNTNPPTYSRKLTKADGILDFTKPAERLEREIRAFVEWPKSRTRIAGKDVIITKAHAAPSTAPDEKPGDVSVIKEVKELYIATADGSLCIEQLKPAGKKEMTAEAFLAGHQNLL